MKKRLIPEQFVLKALHVLSEEGESRNGHLGVRLNELEEAFDRYFDGDEKLAETVSSLIKSNQVIALRVLWRKGRNRSLLEYDRLFSFPDNKVEETNPILYLPNKLPKVLKKRLTRSHALLEMILDD